MTARRRLSEFFGLNGATEQDGRVPPWQGHPPGTGWRIASLWIVLALGSYLVLSARMPENDGFGGFVPLWFSTTIGIAGLYVTERVMLRREAARDGGQSFSTGA